MSLFVAGEVCPTCKHATMHPCGNCLAKCAIGKKHDPISGRCDGYDGPYPGLYLSPKEDE